MKFVKRTTEPSTTDKNWIHTSKGGYNQCILIKGNSVLPNCTGYAWGRWRELLGKSHNLSVNQAEIWFKKNDGYSRGQTPKLGAVICYAKGKDTTTADGSGHVAVVEEIKQDGSIVIGQSGYNTTKRFWTQTLKPPYNYGAGYTLQGFIYIPLEFEGETSSLVEPATPESPKTSFKVGDKVVPTKLVDYKGTKLVQYDKIYTISELVGDRAVLKARGQVWAAMNVNNIKLAE